MTIEGGNRGFTMLGMNVGANQADYTMLLPFKKHNTGIDIDKNTITPEMRKDMNERNLIASDDVVKDLISQYKAITEENLPRNLTQDELNNYKYDLRVRKGEIEEHLFHCLKTVKNMELNDATLITLIFEKGMDILEERSNDPSFQELLRNNSAEFSTLLGNRINDRRGAQMFKQQYPTLTRYLQSNHNKILPKHLKIGILTRLARTIKGALTKKTVTSSLPIENQFQSIKNRLQTNFFKKLVSLPDRPDVLSLQEIGVSHKKSIEILEKAGYEIHRTSEESDTVIALDSRIFGDAATCALRDKNGKEFGLAAYAKNKETDEEFVFVSVHIPGYKLTFPNKEKLEKDNKPEEYDKNLNTHLEAVDFDLQSVVKPAIESIDTTIEELKKIYPNAHFIVQGDFNTYPEYFDESLTPATTQAIRNMNPFSYLEDHANLDCIRTEKATELNRKEDDLQERELDYVFHSSQLRGRVKCFEQEDPELSLTQENPTTKADVTPLHFDPMLLFSDHRPMWIKIDPKSEE